MDTTCVVVLLGFSVIFHYAWWIKSCLYVSYANTPHCLTRDLLDMLIRDKQKIWDVTQRSRTASKQTEQIQFVTEIVLLENFFS